MRDTAKLYADGSLDKRAIIVTDKVMVNMGYVERVSSALKAQGFDVAVFDEVHPDPDMETIRGGVRACEAFRPDLMVHRNSKAHIAVPNARVQDPQAHLRAHELRHGF